MRNDAREPGWDKKAVNRIARQEYGGLKGMFVAHGWDTGGKSVGQVAPTRVVEAYGSIDAFMKAHGEGRNDTAMPDPIAVIANEPPDVWLTSFYGFEPSTWSMLAFSSEEDRAGFLRKSRPGALVVVYGTKDLPADEAGRVLGVLQVSHSIGAGEEFVNEAQWRQKMRDHPAKWNYGVQCIRAWAIPTDCRPPIEEFAPSTYSHNNARAIGRYCLPLAGTEVDKLLTLFLEEVRVFGRRAIRPTVPVIGSTALAPSRPGPVSSLPYTVKEPESPKHLYILRMHGPLDHFLDVPVQGKCIIKVGFSMSPQTRKRAFEAALPGNRIGWEIMHSTFNEGIAAFPNAAAALAGEQAMIDMLAKQGRSLGGEFFLASEAAIEAAWAIGKQTAQLHGA